MKLLKPLLLLLFLLAFFYSNSQSKKDSSTVNKIMKLQLKELWRYYPATSHKIREIPYKTTNIDSAYTFTLTDSNFRWNSSHSFKLLKVLPDSSIDLSKGYCQISTPLFNEQLTKCIVEVHVDQGEWGRYACQYLFEKKRRRWKFVMQISKWGCPAKQRIKIPSW